MSVEPAVEDRTLPVEDEMVGIEPHADLPPAGPAAFITLRDITFANDATNIYVRCTTDISTQLTFRVWRTKDPLTVYTETESPSPILGMRYQTLPRANLGAVDISGETVMIEISTRVPPNPVGSPYLRPYTGSLRITGARSVAKGNQVHVRWNSFTWNRYTWAQYNPRNDPALVTP